MSKTLYFSLLAGLACANCYAVEDSKDTSTPPVQESVRVYVDPETGELTSKAPPNVRAPELAQPQMELIQEIRHPNGMTEWQFNGQAMESVVAQRNADGGIDIYCAEHAAIHQHELTAKESRDE